MNAPPYLWVYVLFANLTITTLIAFGVDAALRSAGFAPERRRHLVLSTTLLLFGWMALGMTLGWLGIFKAGPDRRFPSTAFGIGLPVLAGVWLVRRSASVREVFRSVPQSWLVGIQAYRGLGSMFLVLHGMGLLPGAFALPAGFGDVLVGLTALLVATIYVSGSPGRDWLVAFWNFLGIADLIVAVTSGFLSAPGPFQLFSFGQPNYLVGAYPLVMIPLYAVPLSIILHVASLSKLAWEDRSNRARATA